MKSRLQGTRFHLERPRLRHPQFQHHERQYSLGIRLASGLSTKFKHSHPSLFQTGSRKETNSIIPRVKQYGLVFDKRVIDVTTRSSFPYGHEKIGDELDLLLDL